MDTVNTEDQLVLALLKNIELIDPEFNSPYMKKMRMQLQIKPRRKYRKSRTRRTQSRTVSFRGIQHLVSGDIVKYKKHQSHAIRKRSNRGISGKSSAKFWAYMRRMQPLSHVISKLKDLKKVKKQRRPGIG